MFITDAEREINARIDLMHNSVKAAWIWGLLSGGIAGSAITYWMMSL